MKLGIVVYKEKIYNLDYMSIEELKILLDTIEKEKNQNFNEAKKLLKN